MTVSGVVSMRSIRSEFRTNGDPERRVNLIMLVTILGGRGETSRPWPISCTFGSGRLDLRGGRGPCRPPRRGRSRRGRRPPAGGGGRGGRAPGGGGPPPGAPGRGGGGQRLLFPRSLRTWSEVVIT